MARALEMPADERERRMRRLRTALADNNIYRWGGKILSALLKFEFPEPAEESGRAVLAAGMLP
jgi:trehalose-6-phosphate synthase